MIFYPSRVRFESVFYMYCDLFSEGFRLDQGFDFLERMLVLSKTMSVGVVEFNQSFFAFFQEIQSTEPRLSGSSSKSLEDLPHLSIFFQSPFALIPFLVTSLTNWNQSLGSALIIFRSGVVLSRVACCFFTPSTVWLFSVERLC